MEIWNEYLKMNISLERNKAHKCTWQSGFVYGFIIAFAVTISTVALMVIFQ